MVKTSKGFTLIEILLVTSLFAMVSIAIFYAFSSGVKLWQRSQYLMVEQQAALFLDQMEQELHNSFLTKGLEFKGTSKQCSFPTVIQLPANFNGEDKSSALTDHIGMVEYSFDYEDKTLNRRRANYGQALKKKFFPPEVVGQGIEGLRFSYLYSPAGGSSEFQDHWQEQMPLGVQVEIQFPEKYGSSSLKRLIIIPTRI